MAERATLVLGERRVLRGRGSYLNIVERRRILISGDLVAATLASGLALVFWSRLAEHGSIRWAEGKVGWIAMLAGAWMLCSILLGSYLQPHLESTTRSWWLLGAIGGLILITYSVIYFFAPRSMLPRAVVLAFVVAATALVGAWRRVWGWAGGLKSMSRPIVILGAGRLGQSVAGVLATRNSGYNVIGFVDDDPDKLRWSVDGADSTRTVLGPSAVLTDVVERFGVAELVLAFRGQAKTELIEAVLACHERGVVVTDACNLYEAATGRLPTWHVGDNWGAVLPLAHPGGHALYLASKRFVDIIGAVTGLVCLALLLPFLAVAIEIDSRGPIFYGQQRSGRGGHRFTIWKLRTMGVGAEGAEGAVWASPRDPRVTHFGRWLRRTHLDELPQLWNVLKGDMSLVGPRPERPEIDAALEPDIPFYRLRRAVKPGIAGWGAVNGSYVDEHGKAVERLEYDLYYIKHQSLSLDLQIIARAAHRAVLLRGR